jgi:hypothetical protein
MWELICSFTFLLNLFICRWRTKPLVTPFLALPPSLQEVGGDFTYAVFLGTSLEIRTLWDPQILGAPWNWSLSAELREQDPSLVYQWEGPSVLKLGTQGSFLG